jgi:hypothetical protein
MKENRALDAARDRMRPGAITALGFLGQDSRTLADIIQADEEAFSRLGLDFGETARRLQALKAAGGTGLGEPIAVGEATVSAGDARGVLPCPWDDGVFHKNSVVVDARGERIVYSDLSIHLLEAHHFCQGKGSAFRLEPESLARILG